MQFRAVDLPALLAKIRGGLMVSCQAQPDEPLFGAEVMVKLAHAALEGGAVGIRANSPVDVAAIRQALPDVPLIGLYKFDLPGYEVRITPTLAHALELAQQARKDGPSLSQHRLADEITFKWKLETPPPGHTTLTNFISELEKAGTLPRRVRD